MAGSKWGREVCRSPDPSSRLTLQPPGPIRYDSGPIRFPVSTGPAKSLDSTYMTVSSFRFMKVADTAPKRSTKIEPPWARPTSVDRPLDPTLRFLSFVGSSRTACLTPFLNLSRAPVLAALESTAPERTDRSAMLCLPAHCVREQGRVRPRRAPGKAAEGRGALLSGTMSVWRSAPFGPEARHGSRPETRTANAGYSLTPDERQ